MCKAVCGLFYLRRHVNSTEDDVSAIRGGTTLI